LLTLCINIGADLLDEHGERLQTFHSMHRVVAAAADLLCEHGERLPLHKLGVLPPCRKQLFVRPLLHRLPVPHHNNTLGALYRAQAVRDNEHRPPRHEPLQRLLHKLL